MKKMLSDYQKLARLIQEATSRRHSARYIDVIIDLDILIKSGKISVAEARKFRETLRMSYEIFQNEEKLILDVVTLDEFRKGLAEINAFVEHASVETWV